MAAILLKLNLSDEISKAKFVKENNFTKPDKWISSIEFTVGQWKSDFKDAQTQIKNLFAGYK